MAADWTFVPDYVYSRKYEVPGQLRNELDDHSEIRADKYPVIGGTFTEKHTMSAADLKSALDFFEAKKLTTSFTKLSFDPSDAAFDPADPAAATGPTQTVRFADEPGWMNNAVDDYSVTFVFRILPNE